MKKRESECVCCPPELGCLGAACPKMNIERVYCDECGNEAEYEYEGEDYCEDCLIAQLIEDGIVEGI